jgi:type I protein arginine methyltransferase
MNYNIIDYLQMLTDTVRTDAYARALTAAIKPGDTVTELGTGIGFFAVLAARAGAGHVYAIDCDPIVYVARDVAAANGVADRIECMHAMSTEANLPAADVIVSDMRGVLPLVGGHITAIADARARLLKPGGTLIPAHDTLHVAGVEAASLDDQHAAAAARRFDIDLAPAQRMAASQWRKARCEPDALVTDAAVWARLDYGRVDTGTIDGRTVLTAARNGTVHGLCVWFDTVLYGDVGFSNAPQAPPALYGQALFPLATPLTLAAGDMLDVALRATPSGSDYVWQWSAQPRSSPVSGSLQHSLQALPLTPAALAAYKRSS